MLEDANLYSVAEGQVWERGQRNRPQRLRILEVDSTHATVLTIESGSSRVRLERFCAGYGYRQVQALDLPAQPDSLTHAEFVDQLSAAIELYLDFEDYPQDAKLKDLRVEELALFIPTELPLSRLNITRSDTPESTPTLGKSYAGHVRETTTPGDLHDPPKHGKFIVDCSCGAEYLVPVPPRARDEFDALELGAARHAALVRLGELVTIMRRSRRPAMTSAGLARAIGVAASTVRALEHGRTLPHHSNCANLERFLGLREDWLGDTLAYMVRGRLNIAAPFPDSEDILGDPSTESGWAEVKSAFEKLCISRSE